MRPVGRRPESAAQPVGKARLVEIGRVANRHGVRGELRVLPYNPESHILLDLPSVLLGDPDSPLGEHAIEAARRHKRFVLLRLAGIDTADAAESLIGKVVFVPRERLPPVEPREVYHADLIGCRIVTETGEELGRVREMIATGSNDVCVVDGRRGEHLIPLIDDVVIKLDPGSGEIVVRVLPGLLDP
jgi:16S rRNA processing protein RimM